MPPVFLFTFPIFAHLNLISAENITKSIGDRDLFRSLNFGIQKGDKTGLIGINGTGKTSLLRILAGIDPPESGIVSVRKDTVVGFLGQNNDLDESLTVFENVYNNRNPLITLIREYEKLVEHEENTPEYISRMDSIVQEMHAREAWSYEHRVKEIIGKLGINDFLHQHVSTLSGGQKKRVSLARILAEEPDVLILDEPTNHLDIDTVEWLQHLISTQFDTVLLVTHDRYFLDGVTNQIIELENQKLYKYSGNYAYYLEKKAERLESDIAEREKAQNTWRKELEWMRRMPKARGTKSKSRIEAFGELEEKIKGPAVNKELVLQVKDRRQGGKILEARGIGKTLGNKNIIDHFRHYFQPGEKAGIIGPNGTGKTTLLKILSGQLAPDKGDVVKGENTVIGYYDQESKILESEENKRLIEVVSDIADNIEMADGSKISASQFLTRFKFPPAEQYKMVSKLSGGERKRLQLLKILIQNPNFLILDEPTNDLDIGTLNVLEEFLTHFKGSLLLVSHDRYFMDNLVDHVFVFEGNGQIRDFPGNYTDFKEWKAEQKVTEKKEKERTETKVPAQAVSAPKSQGKLSFNERRMLDKAIEDMEKLEIKKEQLLAQMNGAVTNHTELMQLGQELTETEMKLDEAMNIWIELSERS